jgi:hypothetical protein
MPRLTFREHFLLTKELHDRLMARARAEGKSRSQLLREYVEQGLDWPNLQERRRLFREMTELGLPVADVEDMDRDIEEGIGECP